jgi:hypothetical protein
MVRTVQSKKCLTALFVVPFGLLPNSGVAQSPERGAQTDSGARQTAPAQNADKNADGLKDREALNRFLCAARKRVEEYNTLFRDLATEENWKHTFDNRRTKRDRYEAT